MSRPFFSDPVPLAIAHRGSRLLWPENTMVAFGGAVDLGYRYMETDLHATADRVLVTFHDDTLDRTTDQTGPVADRTWDDLQSVDAGYSFGEADGFPWRGRGVGIPSLEQVVTEHADIKLVLDVKQRGIEGLLADFLRRHGLEDRVIVGSFSDVRLARFRKLSGGEVATSTGPVETAAAWTAARMGRPIRTKADALQVPEEYGALRVVDRKTVEAAHASGLQVHVWTVNDPERMEALLDLGVDGIITDRPDLLNDVLAGRAGTG